MNQSNLYTMQRILRDQLNTVNKLIYSSTELSIAAQIADLACKVDENKVDIQYGPEISSRLHDLAAMVAGDKVKEIYNAD